MGFSRVVLRRGCGSTFLRLHKTVSVTGYGVMLAILVIGFAAGVNVLVGKTCPWAKAAAFMPVVICGGKLFVSCIAGTQS
jgi:predicted tellurium resistance membrane protein TerC